MTESEFYSHVQEAAAYIRARLSVLPDACLVLGSGLGPLTDGLETVCEMAYSDIPYFPKTTVPGHDGLLIVAELSGHLTYIMKGRFHFYEGYSTKEATFYVRVMAELGVKNLIMTNAAGGINDAFHPGELMLITDHISLFCESPLRGGHIDAYGARFPDQSRIYDPELRSKMKEAAQELNIPLHHGVYVYTRGPQYETPAEIRALKLLGADAVGMSTVAESIVASQAGMKVLAVSCITNYAAGITDQPLSHKEVMENAAAASQNSIALMKKFYEKL